MSWLWGSFPRDLRCISFLKNLHTIQFQQRKKNINIKLVFLDMEGQITVIHDS